MSTRTAPEWGIRLGNKLRIPLRIIVAIIVSFGTIVNYAMRVCISIAITQMVVPRNVTVVGDGSDDGVCPLSEEDEEDNSKMQGGGEYDWSQELQGHVLSCFYIGYMFGQVPMGILSEKYGAKWIFGFGVVINSCLSILTPLCLELADVYGIIAVRIIMGFAQGSTFPGLTYFTAHWAPISERSIFGSLVMASGPVGSILGNLVSGQILSRYSWPLVFYVWGVAALVWFFFYIFLVFNSADTHPYLSDKEYEYLMANIEIADKNNRAPTPWGPMLKSKPVWGVIIGQMGHDWCFYVVLTCLPKYFNDVLRFDVEKNGFASAAPYLAMFITAMLGAVITDILVTKGVASLLFMRNFNSFLAGFAAVGFLMGAAYLGCNADWALAFFIAALAIMGLFYPGMKLTPNDLAPNYASIVTAIANAVGAATGYAIGPLTGAMTPDSSLSQWRAVFWLCFIIMCVTRIIYLALNRAEEQWWNNP